MATTETVKAVVIEPDEGFNAFLCDLLTSRGYSVAGGVPGDAGALMAANPDCRIVVTSVFSDEIRRAAASARVIMLYALLTDAKREAAHRLGGRLIFKQDIAWALLPAIAPATDA